MKQVKSKQIFRRGYQGSDAAIPYGHLPKDLKDDDVMYINYEYEGHHGSDGNYTSIAIYRQVEETDEEYELRLETDKISKENARKIRYDRYLKLKEEFEPKESLINKVIKK